MILVTGGAGYIGSHTCVELLENGYEVVVLDNLSNASPIALKRVQEITQKPLHFVQGDIRDKAVLDKLFNDFPIEAVIHFAGLKAVGESVEKPLLCYDNNVTGTVTLLQAMQRHHCNKLVFSSSATVYGDPKIIPIPESAPLSATNPYGRSKLMIEWILNDLYKAEPNWHIAILRYFNPVGAHPSGRIGEDPNGIPNNLMPYITQVAVGKREKLNIFGQDYPTHDGTGVRDYIHVVDLARGHIKALEALSADPDLITVNLGTGQGYSVLDVVKAFEKASGQPIPYELTERRPGDVATCYADPTYAKTKLNWQAHFDIQKMCEDAWRWQKNNPNGYNDLHGPS